MTPQEAIDAIKLATAQIEWEYPMDYAAAFDLAVEVLEGKLKRVKPGIGGNQNVIGCWWYICPECQLSIDNGDKYCRHCGRGLKWNGNEH